MSTYDPTLDGASAFIPVQAEDGKFSVRRLKYGEPLPVIELGDLSASDAEDQAHDKNKAEGIAPYVWWAIAERLKNADV
jgi:hypothetical protein